MKAPTVNGVVSTVLVANTVTAPIPTNVGQASDRSITVIHAGTFDIVFSDDGTSTIPNPVSTIQPFAARILYTFELGPKNTHYKIISGTAGTCKHWLSSRT